jgi:hypothetical protein
VTVNDIDQQQFTMDVCRAVGDLFIIAWPILPPDAFKGTQKQIDDFTFSLSESKIQELNAISTTVSWHDFSRHVILLTDTSQR